MWGRREGERGGDTSGHLQGLGFRVQGSGFRGGDTSGHLHETLPFLPVVASALLFYPLLPLLLLPPPPLLLQQGKDGASPLLMRFTLNPKP